MKTVIVPAQVTTVEDRIVGSLSLTQMVLIAVPVFFSGTVYVGAPPFVSMTQYKYSLVSVLAAVCLLMAFRIRGRLVLSWVVLMARYRRRPQRYVFDKNSSAGRRRYAATADVNLQPQRSPETVVAPPITVTIEQKINVAQSLNKSGGSVSYRTTHEGGIYAEITTTKG